MTCFEKDKEKGKLADQTSVLISATKTKLFQQNNLRIKPPVTLNSKHLQIGIQRK